MAASNTPANYSLAQIMPLFGQQEKGDSHQKGINIMADHKKIDKERPSSEIKNKTTRAERINLLFNGIRTVVALRHAPELLDIFNNLFG